MTIRSAHTFENRFNNGNEVQDSQIRFDLDQPVKPETISSTWTLVDPGGASGMQYFLPGIHPNNFDLKRIGYFISKTPYKPADVPDRFRRW